MPRALELDDIYAIPFASDPQLSPEGDPVAYALTTADPAAEPVVASRLDYKADGSGLLGTIRQHLFVIDANGGKAHQLTAGDFFVSDPVWSPDGTHLAFSTARTEDRDVSPSAAVHVVPV